MRVVASSSNGFGRTASAWLGAGRAGSTEPVTSTTGIGGRCDRQLGDELVASLAAEVDVEHDDVDSGSSSIARAVASE